MAELSRKILKNSTRICLLKLISKKFGCHYTVVDDQKIKRISRYDNMFEDPPEKLSLLHYTE